MPLSTLCQSIDSYSNSVILSKPEFKQVLINGFKLFLQLHC